MNRTVQNALILLVLLGIGIAGRLMSHELALWNFAPVAAIGLFAGYYFARREVALIVPLLVMLVTNLVIQDDYLHIGVELTVYASLMFPVLLRGWLREDLNPSRVLGCAILSSVVFFLTTNFADWWFCKPHTPADFVQAYVAALPFFRMTLAGDLFFSAILFGGYAWATRGQLAPVKIRSDRE